MFPKAEGVKECKIKLGSAPSSCTLAHPQGMRFLTTDKLEVPQPDHFSEFFVFFQTSKKRTSSSLVLAHLFTLSSQHLSVFPSKMLSLPPLPSLHSHCNTCLPISGQPARSAGHLQLVGSLSQVFFTQLFLPFLDGCPYSCTPHYEILTA